MGKRATLIGQELVANSARATVSTAKRLAAELSGGAVVALVGELGAGKTSFVQGMAQGLGVQDTSQVLSPTYTLVNEYPSAGFMLVHLDFYRLTSVDAARALGLEEQIGRSDAITAVEWADLMPDLIPADAVWVTLERRDDGGRDIRVRRGRA